MREVLERPGRTAALVTPDRQLAEAVIAALQRWRIEVDDSAGRPLSQCPSGGYLESLVAMLAADFAPVPTLAFLKHPLASGGISPLAFRERVRQLEMAAFRGYRPGAGLDGIRRKLASKARYADIAEFFEASIAMPLAGLVEAWQMMGTGPCRAGKGAWRCGGADGGAGDQRRWNAGCSGRRCASVDWRGWRGRCAASGVSCRTGKRFRDGP